VWPLVVLLLTRWCVYVYVCVQASSGVFVVLYNTAAAQRASLFSVLMLLRDSNIILRGCCSLLLGS
jgi:hypothetical protein